MLDAVIGLKFGYILCGIIWAVAMGFAVGNYACSLVHRLPRGRLILDKKPYCGNCGTLLGVKDLFPVVSALMLRHRCRYCGQPFPVSHTWTELLVGLLFVLTFLKYGFTEQFVLIAFLGVFLITLAAIHANEGIIMGKVLLCVIVSGMLYRTLQDGTIYGFVEGGFFGLIIGALIWRKQITPVGHIYRLPPQAQLMAVGGLCVGVKELPLFLVLFAGFAAIGWLIQKVCHPERRPQAKVEGSVSSSGADPSATLRYARDDRIHTIAFGFAVMLPVLYPQLEYWLFP